MRGHEASGSGDVVCAWRHPPAIGAAGRCIGARTDLRVDRRKAKRLAHRIRAVVRRRGLPRVVATSPLRRCRDVGRWLRRFGFRCSVDARLAEVDFGRWDGCRWNAIDRAEIDAWAADLDGHAPGGGEAVRDLLTRVHAVLDAPPARVLVTHGGWLSAAAWAASAGADRPSACDWPRAPEPMAMRLLVPSVGVPSSAPCRIDPTARVAAIAVPGQASAGADSVAPSSSTSTSSRSVSNSP